jgi:DNA primase
LPRNESIEYLKKRGLTEDLIIKSDIRAIPKDFDYKPLKDKYGLETLLNAGLFTISKHKENPYPTFFSHRLIIPYFDMEGKDILLLQGRNIDSEDEPKYKFLNGIKTVVYNLKGIADAERNGKKVYITEGAIDCLSCYAAGMSHAIAIGGAMNKAIYEAEIFNRLGNLEVIIATDRDTAGQSFYKDFLKKYKDKFYTLPKVIDWDRIQGAKDMNEALTKKIIILPEQKTGKKRYLSVILNDIFTIEDDGGVLFESGVYYTPYEVEKVKEFTDDEIIAAHLLKKTFQGTIQ